MDYFKILNLSREPFSNSPEPEFFYQSSQHLGCLQKLELAIRLRRGLNVVMGKVGTSKTTLCRQLILHFSETEDDRARVETHLLLDPSFSNPREFLTTVAQSFGLSADPAKSEWQLKESIKHHLFQRGVDWLSMNRQLVKNRRSRPRRFPKNNRSRPRRFRLKSRR